MARFGSRSAVGVLLVLGGFFLLAQTLGLVAISSPAAWAAVFIVAGLVFLAAALGRPSEWWTVIPGFVFLAIGSIIGLNSLAPAFPSHLSGALFLGLIGLAFVAVYLLRPLNWWAIIPGGTLVTLAVVSGIAPTGGRRAIDGGAIFFLGLGLTFLAVYLLPNPRGRMRWAIFPAGAMLLMSAVVGIGSTLATNLVWPVVLIAVGAYLMVRAARRGQS